MNTEQIYKNCNTPYERWKRAGEAIDSIHELQLELSEKMFVFNLVMFGTIVSLVIASMLLSLWFTIGAIVAFLTWNNKVEKYNNNIDSTQRILFKFRLERNLYADMHNKSIGGSTQSNIKGGQRGTFKDCVTVADVKKVYREKAKKHHPDVGGDEETFRVLTVQYKRAIEIAKKSA